MKKTMTVLAAVLTAGTVLVGNASASISADNYLGAGFGLSGSAFSIGGYTVNNANDVVVIGVYIDTGNSAINSLTLNGATATGSIAAGAGRLSLFYFDNPAAGAATISGTTAQGAQSNCGYSIWELSGVDLTATVATTGPSMSGATTITTTAANSFIIDEIGVNNGGETTSPDGDSVLTLVGRVNMNCDAGGGSMASGSATEATAGTYNLGWIPSGALNTGSYVGESAFAFASLTAVPEPTTLALPLFGGLMALGAGLRRCLKNPKTTRK